MAGFGVMGVLARYGVNEAAATPTQLLWSTVAINVAGSFALGLLTAAAWFSTEVRTGIGVGFMGGFTTFSTFSVQAVLEGDAGNLGRATVYVVVSVAGGLAGAVAGYAIGRSLA